MEKEDIRRYSLEDLKRMRAEGKTYTRKDAPKYPVDEDFWKNARLVMPEKTGKTHTGIRIDNDILEWFKSQGPGWQTRMNAVLRHFMVNN